MSKRVKFVRSESKNKVTIHGFYLNENVKRQIKKMFGTKKYSDMFPNLDILYRYNDDKKKYDVYVGSFDGLNNVSNKGLKQFSVLSTLVAFVHERNRPKLSVYVVSNNGHRQRIDMNTALPTVHDFFEIAIPSNYLTEY